MSRLIVFIVSLFGFSQIAFALNRGGGNKDSLKLVFLDNPIVASFDSLLLSNLSFSDALFSYDSAIEVSTPPVFSDSVYESRIRHLDTKTPIDLVYNPYVKQYINVYTKQRRQQMSRMMALAAYYFPVFEGILDQFNLPLELKYLALVESALNPKAKSWAGATGLWQFMYNTGKEYNLKVSSYVDERMDPYRATVAACEFFEKSYSVYGDWSLVLASYNSGSGNVNKAIRRSGGKRNYWQIRRFLPKETRSYVPAFIAVCYAMNYASDHKISSKNPRVLFHEVDTVEVKYQIDFEYLSSSLDISMSELEFLNPSYKINVIPKVEGRPYHLVLPIAKMGAFVENEKEIYAHFIELDAQKRKNYPKYSEQDERIVHRVKGGEYLGKIARRYGCSVKKIQQWNNLKNDNIRVGQRLILYVRPDYV
ncbi:MAG: lytic transglycosylase [Bacteroidetes bacterium MED-G21]|nr:MAG: lytic transglycosylase [Bacteroidetes bacterium MED-G21]